MKILIVQTAKLGDMVCTTPVFRAIKEHKPEAHLIVVGDAVNKEVLKGNPYVDEYVVYTDLTVAKVREISIDSAILLNPNPEILTKLLLARVPKIVVPEIVGGYSPFATWKYKLLSKFATNKVPHRFGHYAPQEYLNALLTIDITSTDTKKDLYFSEDASQKADQVLAQWKGGLKIAISPSAGNKIKNWGGKNFAQVAREMVDKYKATIFLIGGERDKEEIEEMKKNMKGVPFVDTSCSFDIQVLKAFISKMDLLVAVDTGPIYIAEALGVPTVDIVGPMDEREQPPQGDKHRLVYLKDRKAPVLHIMNARMYDEKEARRQVEEITPEMVINEVKKVLN